ncbi:hypothetical protein DFH06DRAFT_1130000, partial [Mycena polygramma]
MSSHPTPTNLKPSEVVMDHRGERDPRYWCLPPFRGDPSRRPAKVRGRGYVYHLVWQGHLVGTFDTWAAAKTSLTGYPGSGNKGFDTIPECIDYWQAMCPLGIHPHPVDPVLSAPQPPDDSSTGSSKPKAEADDKFVKVERVATPSASPRRQRQSSVPPSVNFAIRGEGVISSSPARSQERYEELQRRGEEPDML